MYFSFCITAYLLMNQPTFTDGDFEVVSREVCLS